MSNWRVRDLDSSRKSQARQGARTKMQFVTELWRSRASIRTQDVRNRITGARNVQHAPLAINVFSAAMFARINCSITRVLESCEYLDDFSPMFLLCFSINSCNLIWKFEIVGIIFLFFFNLSRSNNQCVNQSGVNQSIRTFNHSSTNSIVFLVYKFYFSKLRSRRFSILQWKHFDSLKLWIFCELWISLIKFCFL